MAGNLRGARPLVVILGAGFAGIGAAKRLANAAADVVVIDRHDHHTFRPLLYQLATGRLDTTAVRHPLSELLRRQHNTTIRRGTVTSVDPTAHEVHFEDLPSIPYDYLVYALGAEVDFRGTRGAADSALSMYTLPSALRVRRRLSARWGAVRRDPAVAGDGALNIVVVGGGQTGVESAGAIAELYRHQLLRDHPEVRAADARVTLIEAGPRLLPGLAPEVQSYAERELVDRWVDVRTGEAVAAVLPTHLTMRSGDAIRAQTVIWAGGIRGTAVARTLGVVPADGRRIAVDASLSLPGHPEVFVVGDAAAITGAVSANPLPQLGAVALQSGRHAGDAIARMIAATATTGFIYRDNGIMSTIARGATYVQLPDGEVLLGRKAQLAWLTAHMSLLPTNDGRAKAPPKWPGSPE